MSLYIDLTELLASLRKTGIERISGELCRNLPRNAATPVRLHSDHYVALSPALIDAIGQYFRHADESETVEIRRLATAGDSAVIPSSEDTVLVPEIFGDPRATFFRGLSKNQLKHYRFIVYDLLPITHPEYFPSEMPTVMSGYYQIVRNANCGFISEYTRNTYYKRLKRTDINGGVILPLGCNSLGPRTPPILNRSLSFSVLGTIEPRKNHKLILKAFEPLLKQVEGLSLSFLGKMGWVDANFAEQVHRLAAEENSGFRFVPAPDDATIRTCIEQSRATIYISAAEGYGLPPLESLWLGTPVIASRTVPSLNELGSTGIHYVDPLNVDNLRQAVLAFIDDKYANQKIEETTALSLPTWQTFTNEVLAWCGKG